MQDQKTIEQRGRQEKEEKWFDVDFSKQQDTTRTHTVSVMHFRFFHSRRLKKVRCATTYRVPAAAWRVVRNRWVGSDGAPLVARAA